MSARPSLSILKGLLMWLGFYLPSRVIADYTVEVLSCDKEHVRIKCNVSHISAIVIGMDEYCRQSRLIRKKIHSVGLHCKRSSNQNGWDPNT